MNHAIFFREEDIVIPMHLENTISGIPTRIPTYQELALIGTVDIKVLFLTPDSSRWEPHTRIY